MSNQCWRKVVHGYVAQEFVGDACISQEFIVAGDPAVVYEDEDGMRLNEVTPLQEASYCPYDMEQPATEYADDELYQIVVAVIQGDVKVGRLEYIHFNGEVLGIVSRNYQPDLYIRAFMSEGAIDSGSLIYLLTESKFYEERNVMRTKIDCLLKGLNDLC